MKRYLINSFVLTGCLLVLAGGAGCRTAGRQKPAAVQPPKPIPSQNVARAPGTTPPPAARRGWLASIFGGKKAAPAASPAGKQATATTTNKPPPVIENPNKAALIYRIQINDQAIINLTGISPEQRFDVIVDEHGFIKLPYIENIKAEGKTGSELETLIHDSYINQQIYKRITVNVALPNQLQTLYYYVQGELRGTGGRMPWVNGMTVMKAVAAAGGPSDFASSKIRITRGDKTFTLNINDVAKHPEKDKPLLPGDVIVVDKSWM